MSCHNHDMTAENYFRPDIPSTARMYDYYLGGTNNYPADREAAEKAMAALPPGAIKSAILENRRFLGRAVRFLAGEAKIRQFLDIGTGLPTMNQVHHITRDIAPASRVMYVDHDPIVLAHARDMLNGVPGVAITGHDLREPEEILADPELPSLIDFDEPVALLLVAILHFITDEEEPLRLVRTLVDALPSGSYLVISHGTADGDERVDDAADVYSDAKATSTAHMRNWDQVAEYFDGLEFVEPGLVWLPQWRPDSETGLRDRPTDSVFWCGVALKP
jgi:hypothetical protein